MALPTIRPTNLKYSRWSGLMCDSELGWKVAPSLDGVKSAYLRREAVG
jgi:hypothetical protein